MYYTVCTCSRWRPFRSSQRFALPPVTWMTRVHVSTEILRTSALMAFFKLVRSLGSSWHTLLFKCSHRKKSMGVKSGEFGGQGWSDLLLIRRSPVRSCSHCNSTAAMCEAAPSCWKQKSSLTDPYFFSTKGLQNSFRTWMWRFVVMVAGEQSSCSNQNGPMTPWRSTSTKL